MGGGEGGGYKSAIASSILQNPPLPRPQTYFPPPSNCEMAASGFFTGYFQQANVHISEAITAA